MFKKADLILWHTFNVICCQIPQLPLFSRSLKTHLFWFRGLLGLPPGATGIQWRVNIITFNRQSIIIAYSVCNRIYIHVSYCSTNIVPPGAAGIQ